MLALKNRESNSHPKNPASFYMSGRLGKEYIILEVTGKSYLVMIGILICVSFHHTDNIDYQSVIYIKITD